MEKIKYKGKNGVFIPIEEFTHLQEKILAQNELIRELKEDFEMRR